jgi:hypothetical protein
MVQPVATTGTRISYGQRAERCLNEMMAEQRWQRFSG